MGFKRVLGSGIVGMIIFVPMAYLSFMVLDLVGEVTGGLIQNIGSISAALPSEMQGIGFLVFSLAGVLLLNLFPVHWAIMTSPGDVMLLLAILLPWILTGIIIAALFAHSPTGGFTSSLAVGIGYFIIMILIYVAIGAVGARFVPGFDITTILDSLSAGFTGLPFIAAAATAAFEGAALAGVFGAFIGALKYKGEGGSSSKKKKRKSKSNSKTKEPTFSAVSTASSSSTSDSVFCNNCGAKLTSGDEFCTNCGAKV